MHPIIFQTKYFTVYSWGLMVALGFMAAVFISLYLAKGKKIPAEHIMNIYILAAVSALVGARLFFVIQFFGEYLRDPIQIIMVQRGGLVFLGGFIAAFIVIYIYIHMNKLDIRTVLDIISPGVMFGYAIGRIGCFLNGCCYGIVTDVPWAVSFSGDECLRHPTQLYSFLAGIIIFVILLFIFKRKYVKGQTFLSAVLLYAVYRFLLEFFRYSPIHVLGLTPSQYIAIIMFAAAGYFIWKTKSST